MAEVGPVERAKVLQLIEEIRVSANWSGSQTDMLCEVISGEVRDLPAAPDLERDELREALSRTERNRDMWKGQCERQAEQLTDMQATLSLVLGDVPTASITAKIADIRNALAGKGVKG